LLPFLLLLLLAVPGPAAAVTLNEQLDAYVALLKQYKEKPELHNYDFELDRMGTWIGMTREYLSRGDRVWAQRTLDLVAAEARYLDALAARCREDALADARRRELETVSAKLAGAHQELRKLDGMSAADADPGRQTAQVEGR
jgi:hypothetical protein